MNRRYSYIRLLAVILFLLCAPALLCAQTKKSAVRFETVEVYVNAADKALAAYQIEFWVRNGDATIVGVEGGSHPAFREPPFYDPKALQKGRIVLASFNTSSSSELPTGKTHVATLHLRVTTSKEPDYHVKLQTAATTEAKKIPATVTIQRRNP